MDMQLFIANQEYLLVAEEMKRLHSPDYATGFDAGVEWLKNYIFKELLCQKSQQQKSENGY